MDNNTVKATYEDPRTTTEPFWNSVLWAAIPLSITLALIYRLPEDTEISSAKLLGLLIGGSLVSSAIKYLVGLIRRARQQQAAAE